MTSRQQRKLWRHVEAIENFWETLRGARARRGRAAGRDGRGAPVGGDLSHEASADGRIDRAGADAALAGSPQGFTLPSVFVVQGSRGRIAAALDICTSSSTIVRKTVSMSSSIRRRGPFSCGGKTKSSAAGAAGWGSASSRSTDECLDVLSEIDRRPPRLRRVRPCPASARVEGRLR